VRPLQPTANPAATTAESPIVRLDMPSRFTLSGPSRSLDPQTGSAVAATKERAGGRDTDARGEKMNRGVRILIVEDEPNVRLVFRTALEPNGYQIIEASDGETALAWLGQEHLDVVLLDLLMPGVDGLEVLDRLRERGNDTPVVIVSAYDRAPNVVQAMRLGAIDFLSKPLTPVALRATIADVLAREEHSESERRLERPARRSRGAVAHAKRALNHRLFHQAEVLLREAIKQQPLSPESHYLLGVLREAEGKTKAAADAYRAALRVDPNYEPAKLHLVKYVKNGHK
jgi:CheY-like chemotaxis protein